MSFLARVARTVTTRATTATRLSTVRMFSASSSSSSKRLSLALQKEYQQENAMLAGSYYESENDAIKSFITKHPFWKIVEQPLQNEVVLTRKINNEEIMVAFERETEDFDSSVEQNNEEEPQAENEGAAPPMLPFVVVVSKGDKGALAFDCVYRQAQVQIQSCKFYPDSKTAMEDSAVAEHNRRSLYDGPDLQAYDEAFLEKFYAYLEERGINDEFGEFIDTFAVLKERRDYADWLRSVGKFLDA